MDSATKWMLLLAALSFVLGFVALLCSKIYVLDKTTNTETEVDLPLIGKMKTNYPALVFVAVGACLAIYALNQDYQFRMQQQPVVWNIKGQLQQLGHDITDWRWGEIKLVNLGPEVAITKDGRYEVNVGIPAGKSFESVVQQIYYTNSKGGNALIIPSNELNAYKSDPSKSRLQTMTDTTRVYRPTVVTTPDTGASQ